jgi:hypothetical protein
MNVLRRYDAWLVTAPLKTKCASGFAIFSLCEFNAQVITTRVKGGADGFSDPTLAERVASVDWKQVAGYGERARESARGLRKLLSLCHHTHEEQASFPCTPAPSSCTTVCESSWKANHEHCAHHHLCSATGCALQRTTTTTTPPCAGCLALYNAPVMHAYYAFAVARGWSLGRRIACNSLVVDPANISAAVLLSGLNKGLGQGLGLGDAARGAAQRWRDHIAGAVGAGLLVWPPMHAVNWLLVPQRCASDDRVLGCRHSSSTGHR